MYSVYLLFSCQLLLKTTNFILDILMSKVFSGKFHDESNNGIGKQKLFENEMLQTVVYQFWQKN